MKKQFKSVVNKISIFIFRHIAPVFNLNGTRNQYLNWPGQFTKEEFDMWVESLSPEDMAKQQRIMKIIFVIGISLLIMILLVAFAFIRGPHRCDRGGVYAMTGNNCECIGHWYETKPLGKGFDVVHEGMCVGYRL